MNYKKISFLVFIIIAQSYCVNYNNYFYLETGNVFVYTCLNFVSSSPSQCNSTRRLKVVIGNQVIYNGKTYYTYSKQLVLVSGTCSYSSFMFPFDLGPLRIDTLNGAVFYYNTSGCNNETLIDSLNTRLNDVVYVNCVPSPYYYPCIDTTARRKYFRNLNFQLRREYVLGTGLVNNYYFLQSGPTYGSSEQILTGSVINGVVYGDTTMPAPVGINQINSEIPSQFSLSQNYPNPFNPVTNIKFQIPKSEFVKIIVYDALGKEIQTLVNRQLSPGTYSVDFDAASLPSGVYYYRLEAGEFTQTKKMVLIK